jgi:3-oxoacyl-[acyl-carrier protein] reductase
LSLEGRVALVTGSTRGIGWASARRLAEQGATVVLNGAKDAALLEQRVAELSRAAGREMMGLLFDVADDTQVLAALREVHARHRRLDVLVNNAGVLEDAMLGMIAREAIDRVLGVNLKGALFVLQGAARLMMRAKRGSIVNLTSIVGTQGNAGQAVYSASKAAVVGLTLSAAKELAPHGIRVNAIAPGYIDTDMIKHLPPEKHRERLASIALGRIGTPEDVAEVVAFLAGDGARYVTGQVIGVDGGMLI